MTIDKDYSSTGGDKVDEYLKRLQKIEVLKDKAIKQHIAFFIGANFGGLTREQRYYFILGGISTLFNVKVISQADFYALQDLMDEVLQYHNSKHVA